MEEIFHGESSSPLKIRENFYTGEGWGPHSFLAFQCLFLRLPPLCLGTSKQGRASSPTLLLYIHSHNSC
jgi:hypothetical protein